MFWSITATSANLSKNILESLVSVHKILKLQNRSDWLWRPSMEKNCNHFSVNRKILSSLSVPFFSPLKKHTHTIVVVLTTKPQPLFSAHSENWNQSVFALFLGVSNEEIFPSNSMSFFPHRDEDEKWWKDCVWAIFKHSNKKN